MRGARGALERLFTDLPDVQFRMAWAGIDMMPTDDEAAVAEIGARLAEPRLTMFHDPQRRLGRAMARCLGWKHHLAWDTYLLYAAGQSWDGADPPTPDEWFHQLKDREIWQETAEAEFGSKDWTQCLAETCEADEAKFRTGEDLCRAMTAAVRRLATT